MNLTAWVPTAARVHGFVWASRIAIANGGLPRIALCFKGGLGDEIMCTVVAHELRKRKVGKIWHLTRFPELFDGNPDLTAIPQDFRLRRLCEVFGVPFLDLDYPHPPPMHLIATMCRTAGIRGEVELTPRIFLTDAEKQRGSIAARAQIAIQTSNVAARYPMRNKQWPVERFQAVAEDLGRDFDLVQLGLIADPVLRGSLDFRGRTNVREAAAILSNSRVFIGLEGGLMHLARAVGCRSAIIYGGRVHPNQTGYSANENLNWSGACAPCWQRDDCDYDRICLRGISVEMVTAAVRRQASLYGKPLPVDLLTI